MQCLGDDKCRPRIVSHAVACNAWATIDVALALLVMLLHACLGDDCCRPRIVSHAVACNVWATIVVALVLLVMLLHAMLGRR